MSEEIQKQYDLNKQILKKAQVQIVNILSEIQEKTEIRCMTVKIETDFPRGEEFKVNFESLYQQLQSMYQEKMCRLLKV